MPDYFRFYTSKKKQVRGRQFSDASKATTCTKKPAQKPAVSTKTTTARGKGGRVKKGCATTHWKMHLQYPMMMMKMRTSKKRTLKTHREKEAQREKEIQRKGCKSQRQGDASQ